ncbi:MAG: protein TolR [Gammaproteobacteria bacterium]
MRKNRRNLVSDINVVPYIDVMLVLLVVFMVAAPLMIQGVVINLPEAASRVLPLENDEPLIISIDSEGNFFLETESFEGQVIEPNSLKLNIEKILKANPSIQVVVRGDSQVKYEKVMELMSLLQSAGAEGVGLITKAPRRR